MKRFISALVIAAGCLVIAGRGFAEQAKAGVGIIVGEPTGIAGKLFLSENTALDAGAAWSLVEDSRFHFHADFLRHNHSILKREFGVTEGELPLYFGIGARLRFDKETRAGIRFVVGVSYLFEDAPFDVFCELAPVMDLAPETELDGNIGAGFRWWFR